MPCIPPERSYKPRGCARCARTFASAPNYLDLTLTSGVSQAVYEQKAWQGTELFRQPLVSFIYERGWRQNFAGAGFPGPEKEFEQAMRYLEPAAGGTLLDVSCGTGLFTRLFARSGRFKGVVALDFRCAHVGGAGSWGVAGVVAVCLGVHDPAARN